MAIENPTKYVSVQRLGRFEEKLGQKYATRTAMAAAVADVTLDYIDIEDLEVGMTFPKNALLAINGVSYQAKKATTQFPVMVLVESGHIVYDEDAEGRKALVVEDYTLSEDWKVWGDAGIPRTLDNMTAQQEDFMAQEQANMAGFEQQQRQAFENFEAEQQQAMTEFRNQVTGIVATSIKSGTKITSTSGREYTVQTLLTAVADLMEKTIVIDEETT